MGLGKIPLSPPGRAPRIEPLSVRSAQPGAIQAKLAIGPVDDPLEREADVVADRALQMPDPALSKLPPDHLTLTVGEDSSEKNPRLASFAATALQTLSASPKAIISIGAFWSSQPAFVPGAGQTAELTLIILRTPLVPAPLFALPPVAPVVPSAPSAKKPTDDAADLAKFTTFQVKTPAFTLVVKVPKSIELKTRLVAGKISIPKGASLTFKPVRGLPGVEISLSGEITKLSDLLSPPSPTPAWPGAAASVSPGPAVKFSLSAAVSRRDGHDRQGEEGEGAAEAEDRCSGNRTYRSIRWPSKYPEPWVRN
jgi:hypothetical protein